MNPSLQGWESSQDDVLRGYPSSVNPDSEGKPRPFSRHPVQMPLSYDYSPVPMQLCNDELPYPPTSFHPSSIGYPESSQRTAFRMDSQPPFDAQEESFSGVTEVQHGSTVTDMYNSLERDYTPCFSSPESMVDATVSMWTPPSTNRPYHAQLQRAPRHGGSIQHDRASPPAPAPASAQWSHQHSDSRYALSQQADASAQEASIPMREDSTWFPVVHHSSSTVADAITLAYSRGHSSRNLPATTLEHALDEGDANSDVDSLSHDLELTPDTEVASVGQTVGIEKRKKKSKMHQCEVCHKFFPRPSGLKTHMNTHNNLKPFACEYPGCNRSFTVRSNARRHLRTHGVIPETSTSSGPDYVVNFDEPVVPEFQNQQITNVPQKIKWMTPIGNPFPRPIPENEESESDFDELEDDLALQRGFSQLTTRTSPGTPGSEMRGSSEGSNSHFRIGAYPPNPPQVNHSPP
ncbi:hypothetical protein AAF712_003603 [Marasmius tenuissimus]|uniref:C2H2-type domain-containing protein n=1 Tax=Marasmius tenuissimus TaxID=585030 RepID=A0ABR3A5K9_9AGAR